MSVQLEKFFRTILPSESIYAIMYRPKGGRVKHQIHLSFDTFIQSANNPATNTDYWFAMSNFVQGRHNVLDKKGNVKPAFRTQENSKNLRCLFLDIDAGEDKPYANTSECLVALKEFCVSLNIDVPTIVRSGSGGLHVYWAFDEDLPKDEWKYLAKRLHQATATLGLQVDTSRTCDNASVLRIPNTLNYKKDIPTNVELVYLANPRPVDYYRSLLESYEPVIQKKEYESESTVLGADFLQAIKNFNFDSVAEDVENIPTPEFSENTYEKRKAVDVVAQCLQIQRQENAPEPVWRGMLATLRHCEEGYEYSHKLSKQDKRYDPIDTDDKISQLEAKEIAPYTCETFNRLRPEVCAECPHRGMINSPISVPKSLISTVQVDEVGNIEKVSVEEEDVDLPFSTEFDASLKTFNSVPNIETDNFRINETGCFVKIEHKGTDKWWWDKFYPYPVYPIQRIRDKSPNGDVAISYVFRKHHRNGYDDFQIMGEMLMGQGVYGFLGSVGFLLDKHERKHMADFMIDLLKNVGNSLEETEIKDNLGWDDDMKSFFLGNKLYKTNGQVVDISPRGNASDYSQRTVAKGTVEQWTEISDVYNHKGAEWGQLAIASAFASPLMPIGSLERAALMFLTGEKGAGKSTALYMAVSVFADPTRMLINKDDTKIARLAKLGIMSNISVGFDEMTDLSPHEASELAYQITQGRGKDKMASGGEGILHNKTFWSCLPIMSANDSIINTLAQHSFDATAQMSRILEVRAKDIAHIYSKEEFERCEILVRKLPQNYGTAGDKYIRWVTANMPKVEEMIIRMEKLVSSRLALGPTYRFWTYMCTRMMVGITIAKELGLVNYDIDNLLNYMVETVLTNKARLVSQKTDTNTLLGSFLNEHIANRIVVKSDSRPIDKPFKPEDGEGNDLGYVIQKLPPGRDLHIRIAREEGLVYIDKLAIKSWCVKTGTPYDMFMRSVEDNSEIIKRESRVLLGKFTQWADTSRVSCLIIKINGIGQEDEAED